MPQLRDVVACALLVLSAAPEAANAGELTPEIEALALDACRTMLHHLDPAMKAFEPRGETVELGRTVANSLLPGQQSAYVTVSLRYADAARRYPANASSGQCVMLFDLDQSAPPALLRTFRLDTLDIDGRRVDQVGKAIAHAAWHQLDRSQ